MTVKAANDVKLWAGIMSFLVMAASFGIAWGSLTSRLDAAESALSRQSEDLDRLEDQLVIRLGRIEDKVDTVIVSLKTK